MQRSMSYVSSIVLLLVSGACTQGVDLLTSPIESVGSPLPLLEAIGCRSVTAEYDGVVVVPLRSGGNVKADCKNVDKRLVAQTIREYFRTSSPGTEVSALYETVNVRVYYHCEVTTVWEYNPGWGDYVVVSQEGWCKTWMVMEEGGSPGSFSLGGGGYGPLPAELPWTPEPLVEDSLAEDRLNWAETARCALHWIQCGVYVLEANKSLDWANENAPLGDAHNNIWDARRHALWSALLTRTLNSSSLADLWTNLHEEGSTRVLETCMDQHNNAIGRQIGEELGYFATDSQLMAAVLARTDLQATPQC